MKGAPKQLLQEVSLIRPILILLLVIYHSFIIYQGGWTEPVGFEPIKAYWWISKTSYSFMLECFVFISGYVFAHQVLKRGGIRKTSGGGLTINKLQRLIIPSILFSILYFALFYTYSSPWNCLYTIVNGAGHMWFLPMLFWCFMGCWIILRTKLKENHKLILVLLISLGSFVPLPLRMGSAMYYLLFFYGGYWIYQNKAKITNRLTINKIITLWIAYALFFVTLTLVREYIDTVLSNQPIYAKAILISGKILCKILYAGYGIMALYLTAMKVTSQRELNPWIIKAGEYCMGAYIFQQFILQILYYKTNLPTWVGPIWLPWTGFIITLILSLLFTILAHKTTLGRKLL